MASQCFLGGSPVAVSLLGSVVDCRLRRNSDATAPAELRINPQPTKVEAPASAFGQEEIDYLVDLLEEDAGTYGWVAGCIWPEGTEDKNTLYPGELIGMSGGRVASGTWGFSSGNHVATVYQPEYRRAPVVEFEKIEGSNYLCYRPK